MRSRAAAAGLSLVLVLLSLGGVRPATAELGADDAIINGSALAAAGVVLGNVEPNFDFWPVYSNVSIDNEASHGLSGAIWPGFLVDAFFWLYGFQTLQRAAMGISESQYPNPPHETNASSSAFMLANFSQGCEFLFGPGGDATDGCRQATAPLFTNPPGSLGNSSSRSGHLRSDGDASAARFAYPGILEAEEVVSRSAARFSDGRTVTESVFTARELKVGESLRIGMLQARSAAVATASSESKADTSLRVVDARWGEVPVEIDDQGVHVAGDAAGGSLNEALASQGLEVRLLQGRREVRDGGEVADAASGGLLVRVFRERAEEAFPIPVGEMREAACRAAEESPLNRELTRIRVSEPNPLFGQVPFAPLPERLELEQSVPPPFSCPFLNRSFEVGLVIGITNASARLTPLEPFEPPPATGPTQPGEGSVQTVVTPDRVLGFDLPAPGSTGGGATTRTIATEEGEQTAEARRAGLVAAFTEGDVAARLRVLYLGIMLLAFGGVAGRFFFRSVSAP